MSRFGNLAQQYLDGNGDPLSNGEIYFFEPGTTTDKTVYQDDALTTPHAQPVALDADGRQPDIFFTGEAKAVLYDQLGTLVDTADPIGDPAEDSGIGDWESTATYDIYDLVKGSDDQYYLSTTNGNQGNDPTSPSPSYWTVTRLVTEWNTNHPYTTNDIVIHGGQLWISKVNPNQGNTPAYGSANWDAAGRDLQPDLTMKTGNFTIEAGKFYITNTNGGSFNATLPNNPTEGDMFGLKDAQGTWGTNNLVLERAASGENIENLGQDMDLNKDSAAVYFMYTSGKGWILV